MSMKLVLFEDRHWRTLRPLTDLLPVGALAFGASTLARRWLSFAELPLAGLAGRALALDAWTAAPPFDPRPPEAHDEILAVNSAALPGPWIETALRAKAPLLVGDDRRIACVRAPWATLGPGVPRGPEFESFLLGLGLPRAAAEARFIAYPWNLIEWNAEAIAQDLAGERGGIAGQVDPRAALLEPQRITIEAGARIDPLAVLDARSGPIRIESGAIVHSHTVVVGPCVVGAGTQLLGGWVSRSTLGPQCRIAGEVEECLWQGHANKRHHGFVGHSVVGEWVNLGALTTTSDLKNNYGPVRVRVDGKELDSGTSKLGSLIGAHVKTGIGTLLPTGASIGVGSNLFGGGRFAPKDVPPFSWWDGERLEEHRLEPFLATARTAASRRGRILGGAEEQALRELHASTEPERSRSGAAPAPHLA